MSRYMPVYQYPEMMPVDISFVFEDEVPAGKHGFCQVDGENFRFRYLREYYSALRNDRRRSNPHRYGNCQIDL